jgi:hypothetical protein
LGSSLRHLLLFFIVHTFINLLLIFLLLIPHDKLRSPSQLLLIRNATEQKSSISQSTVSHF